MKEILEEQFRKILIMHILSTKTPDTSRGFDSSTFIVIIPIYSKPFSLVFVVLLVISEF